MSRLNFLLWNRGHPDFCTTLTKSFEEAGLQLGWTRYRFCDAFKGIGSFLNKLIGLFISDLLISFGAPFWHDFLTVFVGIRKTLRGREAIRGVLHLHLLGQDHGYRGKVRGLTVLKYFGGWKYG